MNAPIANEIWVSGIAECHDCHNRWVAVWPLAADPLECPHCHGTHTDRDATGYPESDLDDPGANV